MPLVLPDGFGLCTIHWRIGAQGGDAVTVIGVENSGTAFVKASTVKDAVENNLLPEMGDAVILERVKVTQRDGAVYSQGEWGSGQNGEVAQSILPPNCTYLVRKLTTGLGRPGRGRMYLPGPLENEVTNSGYLSPSRVTSLQNAVEQFLVDTGPQVIFHRDPLDPSNYDADPPTELFSFSVEAQIATQRRRLR